MDREGWQHITQLQDTKADCFSVLNHEMVGSEEVGGEGRKERSTGAYIVFLKQSATWGLN